ncbi:MAG: TlpA disulfide reductase family protein [Ferruginibacter sp.]
MKKFFLLLSFLPLLSQAQKKATVSKKAVIPVAQKLASGTYRISGTVTGYPEGTVVDLLNGYNGTPEATTNINNGKFFFTGKTANPDLKILTFGKQPPYLTFFLDNSDISIKGSKEIIEKAVVSGSLANNEFIAFNNVLEPYQQLFTSEPGGDSNLIKKGKEALQTYISKYSKSYVSPLAIVRYYQLSADADQLEQMFLAMSPALQSTPLGQYSQQQITEAKRNPVGKPLADFSQADTAGNALTLSSLKGKYVLIDFWASWCGPCRQENPNVVDAFQKYKGKNFTILGVSLDKTRKAWIDAIAMDQLTWPHVSDLQGWQNAVAQQYQIFSIPQNFLIDPMGIIVAKNLRGPALHQKLASLLK